MFHLDRAEYHYKDINYQEYAEEIFVAVKDSLEYYKIKTVDKIDEDLEKTISIDEAVSEEKEDKSVDVLYKNDKKLSDIESSKESFAKNLRHLALIKKKRGKMQRYLCNVEYQA